MNAEELRAALATLDGFDNPARPPRPRWNDPIVDAARDIALPILEKDEALVERLMCQVVEGLKARQQLADFSQTASNNSFWLDPRFVVEDVLAALIPTESAEL